MKPVWICNLMLLACTSCRQEPPPIEQAQPATQRVAATKSWSIGLWEPLPPQVDTVFIQGKPYLSASSDSTRFYYDAQDRLTRVNVLQVYSKGSSYVGDPAITRRQVRWTTYRYQGTQLLIEESLDGQTLWPSRSARLDAGQRRIVSRTTYEGANFTWVTDTLRRYSGEGLLVSSTRIDAHAGLPTRTTYQQAQIEAGNLIQLTATDEVGKVIGTVSYEYDLGHAEPLATLTPLGESSRNALRRAVWINSDGSTKSRTAYSYDNEYDERGRLIQRATYYQSLGMLQRKLQNITRYYY